ncbi:hypothetical protein NEOLI_002336 [Neolecta irregularis DAH-3]|uniref:Uncharacterized protein n=1 Tax=Neolecta irregularis (strain DAH-3) TaxID=1198029 RepID=A0A1U7LV47_NEOID|nr:hypothetical protein NEOLI_002336 [Neolecta irregularis DAH-3]|eukprot:OLL26499.1 hypothetical protein NEOLI_002336 [Neolecta irregularis DAH-3]
MQICGAARDCPLQFSYKKAIPAPTILSVASFVITLPHACCLCSYPFHLCRHGPGSSLCGKLFCQGWMQFGNRLDLYLLKTVRNWSLRPSQQLLPTRHANSCNSRTTALRVFGLIQWSWKQPVGSRLIKFSDPKGRRLASLVLCSRYPYRQKQHHYSYSQANPAFQ